jgi:uncharacterized protein
MYFKELSPEVHGVLKKFFETFEYSLSYYSLAELVTWNKCAYNNFYFVKDKHLFISEYRMDFPNERYLLLPLPANEEVTPEFLHKEIEISGCPEYRFIPEEYVVKHANELVCFFDIEEQPQYQDYIYLQSDLEKLLGRKYASKRNLIRQFERDYVKRKNVSVDEISLQNINAVKDFLDKWFEQNSYKYTENMDSFECERKALNKTLDNFKTIECRGLVIKIDDSVVGLGIGTKLNPDMGILNVEKAFEDIKGLYQFLDNQCAKKLFFDCKYINKEGDIGDAGLAKSKQSYYPAKRTKSFKLIPK